MSEEIDIKTFLLKKITETIQDKNERRKLLFLILSDNLDEKKLDEKYTYDELQSLLRLYGFI